MSNEGPNYQPNDVKSPGQLLKETLEDMGIEPSHFRQKAGIEQKYFYRFLLGKAPLSDELASRLVKWAKVPLWLWERHEKKWQEHLKTQEELSDV